MFGGSDGHCLRGCILPPGALVVATSPNRKRAGASRRDTYQNSRARKLDAEEQSRLRSVADGRSLRSLAVEFGVSHELVRMLLRATDRLEGVDSIETKRPALLPTRQ